MISERADGLTISPKAEIGYFTQTGYKFNTHKSVLSFMQEECEYTVAGNSCSIGFNGIGANDIQKTYPTYREVKSSNCFYPKCF